jgi:hypothetical protein
MKTTIFAIAIAMTTLPAFACETKPIANSNATQKVDPTCGVPMNTTGGFLLSGRLTETVTDSHGERKVIRATLATNLTDPATNLVIFR